mmetsp:Transcript_24966/g.68505  ORF Transcript_24966/g.68505 Transcript_24966/m.68505 type:complete len:239 (+) Transcript_24966:364-1080(+)
MMAGSTRAIAVRKSSLCTSAAREMHPCNADLSGSRAGARGSSGAMHAAKYACSPPPTRPVRRAEACSSSASTETQKERIWSRVSRAEEWRGSKEASAREANRRALDSRMESEILSHAFTKRTSGKSDDRAAAAAAESAASKTAGEVSRTRPATPPRSASANSEKSLPSRSGLSRPLSPDVIAGCSTCAWPGATMRSVCMALMAASVPLLSSRASEMETLSRSAEVIVHQPNRMKTALH